MGAEQETTLNGKELVDTVVDEKKVESKMEVDAKPAVPPAIVQELKPSVQPKSVAPAQEQVVTKTGEHPTIPTKSEEQSQAKPSEAEEVAMKKKATSEQAAAPTKHGEKAKTAEGEQKNAVAMKSTVPLPVAQKEAAAPGAGAGAPAARVEKTTDEHGKAVEEKEQENENLKNINTLLLNDDEVASTLAAASKKLAAAHAKEKRKNKSLLAKFFEALSPKRVLVKFRDCYVNTCMMASEKGDFSNLVAGHPGMFYGSDNVMSRTSSQKRERDHEEVLASLSRQVSASLSRQASQAKRGSSPGLNRTASTGISGLKRNASAGIPGLSRNTSAGIAGLNRSGSTGMPSLSRQASTGMSGGAFGRNSSTRRHLPESELFKGGRSTFLESVAAKNSSLSSSAAADGNAAVKTADSSAPSLSSISTSSALQQKKSQ